MVHHQFQARTASPFSAAQREKPDSESRPCQISGRPLKFLDCSGNDRAAHLVKAGRCRGQPGVPSSGAGRNGLLAHSGSSWSTT